MAYGSFGLGWIVMLVVICLPVLAVLGLIGVGIYVYNRNRSITRQNQAYQPGVPTNQPAPKADRYCSHCGAGLQSDWSHCPQCGAPIQ
jgi:hypothetical protein